MTASLLADLRRAAAPPSPPKGYEAGVMYIGSQPAEITTPPIPALAGPDDYTAAVAAMGVPIPEGSVLELVEAKMSHNEGAWARDVEDKGAPHTAYTKPASTWVYRFKVVRASALAGESDLKALFKEAKRAAKLNTPAASSTTSTLVVTLGDFQLGKVDSRGGILELLERNEVAKAKVIRRARYLKPAEIVLIDGGDAMEGFESSPNADRTNDLQETEQETVWRRLLWSWIHDLSRLTPDLKVVGVPSNHCRVRRGKNAVGSVNDDRGLAVIGQVRDIAAINPDAYGHITFHVPPPHDEHLAVTLAGGKVLGAVHGHQRSNPTGMLNWLEGQAAGRSPIGHADVVVINHFHNLYVQTWGDDRWAFGAPTMDSGSSWFRNITGKESRPGILTFVMDDTGWRDLFVAWA